MNFLSKKHKEELEMYVGENLLSIMEEQEKRLGIRHFGVPKIVYDIPGYLSPFFAIFMNGNYNSDFNEIYLRHQKVTVPNMTYANILPVISPLSHMAAKDVLEHELGHFYSDNLSKSLGFGSWPRYGKFLEENIIKKLVSEGIAEYFRITAKEKNWFLNMDLIKSEIPRFIKECFYLLQGRTISGFEDIKTKEKKGMRKLVDWPGNRIDVLARAGAADENIRNYGFCLVKPIIDSLGKTGISHLVANELTVEDFDDILQYQANVIARHMPKIKTPYTPITDGDYYK